MSSIWTLNSIKDPQHNKYAQYSKIFQPFSSSPKAKHCISLFWPYPCTVSIIYFNTHHSWKWEMPSVSIYLPYDWITFCYLIYYFLYSWTTFDLTFIWINRQPIFRSSLNLIKIFFPRSIQLENSSQIPTPLIGPTLENINADSNWDHNVQM